MRALWIKCAVLLALALPLGAQQDHHRFDPEHYLSHVKYLSSEELHGRGTGTAGIEKAASYIEKWFRPLGVGVMPGGAWLQPFPITINARLGKKNRLEAAGAGLQESLKVEQDFVPLPLSATGTFAGPVVFAGYGISAREYNYDDFEGVDARGKWVMILRHEPQEFNDDSIFSGRVYTEHSQYYSKALNARRHGALGVLMVNDTVNHGGSGDELEPFSALPGAGPTGLPFLQVKAEKARRWVALAGKDLAELEKGIDEDLRPRSFELPADFVVRAAVDLKKETRQARNAGVLVPGRTDEYVIVGAHYDHVGLGEQFSMAPSESGKTHPGADDNASGTAGVLELARYFSSRPPMRRGVLFLAFAGEEIGLLGSSHFIHHPPVDLGKAVAMINLDMIGRIRDNEVFVGGVSTSKAFPALFEELGGPRTPGEASWRREPALRFDTADRGGYGSSDHTSFTAAEVPILFFFSGLHADYHRPSDTWEKIDAPQAARLLDFVAAAVEWIANRDARPVFTLNLPDSRSTRTPQAVE